MESKKLIYQDHEKSIYEMYVHDNVIPDWMFVGGNPDGWGCLTRRDNNGEIELTDLFRGCSWNHPDTKCFAIVPKQPQRLYELYAVSFVGGCFNGLTCYGETQWDIPLREVLDRFSQLYSVPEIQQEARRYAVPQLIYSPDQVQHEFDQAKQQVKQPLLTQLKERHGLSRLHRQSLYHWAVGIKDKKDQHIWVAVSLFWNRARLDIEQLVDQMVDLQRLDMFASNSERATIILHEVIKPFVIKNKIDRLAKRYNTLDQLTVLEQWTAENFMQLMSECFVEYWTNERP